MRQNPRYSFIAEALMSSAIFRSSRLQIRLKQRKHYCTDRITRLIACHRDRGNPTAFILLVWMLVGVNSRRNSRLLRFGRQYSVRGKGCTEDEVSVVGDQNHQGLVYYQPRGPCHYLSTADVDAVEFMPRDPILTIVFTERMQPVRRRGV